MSRPVRWLLLPALAGIALIAVYALAGGSSYQPTATPDPCQPRSWPDVNDTGGLAQQVTLSALDGAACKLGVSSEQLTLAFTSRDRLDRFASDHGLSQTQIQEAARDGLNRAIDDGERSGTLNSLEAFALRLAVRAAPIDRLIDYVRQSLT
jgi:hypothetical protein